MNKFKQSMETVQNDTSEDRDQIELNSIELKIYRQPNWFILMFGGFQTNFSIELIYSIESFYISLLYKINEMIRFSPQKMGE